MTPKSAETNGNPTFRDQDEVIDLSLLTTRDRRATLDPTRNKLIVKCVQKGAMQSFGATWTSTA